MTATASPAAAPAKGASGPSTIHSGGGGGTGPNPISTQHPSILPLRLEGGRVVHAAAPSGAAPAQGQRRVAGGGEGVVMDRLAPALAPNLRDSPPNALVFGVASQQGPVSQLDTIVGSVSALLAGGVHVWSVERSGAACRDAVTCI